MQRQKRTHIQEEYIYSRGRKIPLSSIRMNMIHACLDGAARCELRRKQDMVSSVKAKKSFWKSVWNFRMVWMQHSLWKEQFGFQALWQRMSPARAWQYSLAGMLVIGVVGTSFVYQSFGRGALADNKEGSDIFVVHGTSRVLGAEAVSSEEAAVQEEFEQRVQEMVKGYPIEDMLPYIFKYDRKTAAFFIAIARKESLWGKRVPVYYGENCFNYLGYRGQDEIMGSAGHTCFDTPKDAVIVIGNRLQELIDSGRDTASKLIVWKCGYSCEGHSDYSVEKWISDVDEYYRYIMDKGLTPD